MQKYKNPSIDFGVTEYEIGEDFIEVNFKDKFESREVGARNIYRYTYTSAGYAAVEEMKKLAQMGNGLTRYITENKPQYASKR